MIYFTAAPLPVILTSTDMHRFAFTASSKCASAPLGAALHLALPSSWMCWVTQVMSMSQPLDFKSYFNNKHFGSNFFLVFARISSLFDSQEYGSASFICTSHRTRPSLVLYFFFFF